jgi:tetratricopeptide (TPR) repeat protein
MTGRIFATFIAAVIACSTWGEPAAAAQPKSSEKAALDVRARELFQKGDTAYAEGRYEEAHTAFHEAYELSGRPQLLFNISNALERLGRYTEAVEALEKYLASGKAKDRDVVQKRLANLRKRVDEQKKADEKNKEEEEKKRAEEKTKADEQQEAAVKKAAASKPEGGGAQPGQPAGPTPPPEKPTRILPIVLLGGGGLALVTSGVFGLLTLSARSDVNAGCKNAPEGRLCSSDASSAISRDKTFGLVTDIALVSGVVLAGAGVYFLIAGGGDDNKVKVGSEDPTKPSATSTKTKAEQPSKMRVEARPTGAGVEVVGTF